MTDLADRILTYLQQNPGPTDRELTDILVGKGAGQQAINQICRRLASRGILSRHQRADGLIGNFLNTSGPPPPTTPTPKEPLEASLSEDSIKSTLNTWLEGLGWDEVDVRWGHTTGIDIDARKGGMRWAIEVKGNGSRPQMRVNYFLQVLGETLQRMDDPQAKYSIALPDLPQFRNLWARLPSLAKSRTGLTALFVDSEGRVRESH